MTKNIQILIGLIPIYLAACSYGTKKIESNKLDSDDFKEKKERIEVLKSEIKSSSEFHDAEFELFNVNGFSNSRNLLPGASSWDYKFAVKVDIADISKWTNGLIEKQLGNYDYSWTTEIVKERKMNWKTSVEPKCYTRKVDGMLMLVFESDGIIFKRVFTE